MFTCKTITRKVGGREYQLQMNCAALQRAEELTGQNFLDEKLWADMNVTCMTALFFASAVQGGEKISLEDVRSLPPSHLADVVDACREAWAAANEVPEQDPRPTDGQERLLPAPPKSASAQ